MFFQGGKRCCSHGRAAEGKTICVCASERANQALHFFFFFAKCKTTTLAKLTNFWFLFFSSRQSTLIGAVRLLHRAVSASSHSPSAAHTLAHFLTQEILKTVCYFCLIIHLNRTSYTKPTRSAAYSSDVSLCFFLYFCRSECSWNGTFNHRHRAGRSTLINTDAEGRRVLWW